MNVTELLIRVKEQEKIYSIDPALLIRHNPAAQIAYAPTYTMLQKDFSPDKFEPLDIVRVKTYSPERGQVTKPLLIDGMTRAKYAFDNKTKNPTFSFDTTPVRDITHAMAMNLSVVERDEAIFAENGLSILQYLKAVMPYAFLHPRVAPERIATLVMNGWDNTIGYVTAKNISGLRALHFLKDSFHPLVASHLRDHVEKSLDIDSAFADYHLSPEERERVRQGFIVLATIIQIEGFDRLTLAKIANAAVKERKQAKTRRPPTA